MSRQARPTTGAAAGARARSRSPAARTRAAAACISAPASTPPGRRCATARIRLCPEASRRRMYLTARRNADELKLELSGEWRALRFSDIETELGAVDFAGVQRISIAAAQAQLDLTGAWLLRDF